MKRLENGVIRIHTEGVTGSIPVASTILFNVAGIDPGLLGCLQRAARTALSVPHDQIRTGLVGGRVCAVVFAVLVCKPGLWARRASRGGCVNVCGDLRNTGGELNKPRMAEGKPLDLDGSHPPVDNFAGRGAEGDHHVVLAAQDFVVRYEDWKRRHKVAPDVPVI